MNLTGTWTYNEDFEYGNSIGNVEIMHFGNELSGVFTFTEKVDDEYEIQVRENVKGIVNGGKALLESVEVVATQDEKVIEYLPNSFMIQYISENKLVGSTYDAENVCGVFVMDRESAK